jgi:phospholipase C
LATFTQGRRRFLRSAAATGGIALLGGSDAPTAAPSLDTAADGMSQLAGLRERIDHIIVIYQENRSFDHYFGAYRPASGAPVAGLLDADGRIDTRFDGLQRNAAGAAYKYLPMPYRVARFPHRPLRNRPFHLAPYIPPDDNLPYDPMHQFFRMGAQINLGRMDRFVALAVAGRHAFFETGPAQGGALDELANSTPSAAVLGFYAREDLPRYHRLADEYVLLDHFFQAMTGGSTGNALYLVAARPCRASNPPQAASPGRFPPLDLAYDRHGTLVNDAPPVQGPTETFLGPIELCPPPEEQTHPHIGTRLDAAAIPWAWYGEGWAEVKPWALMRARGAADSSVVVDSTENYLPHHNPFQYFPSWFDHVKRGRIRDSDDFLEDLRGGRLPQVCFLKATGSHDEHPANSAPRWGEHWVMSLLEALGASRYWSRSLVVITYDEGGGYWDHLAPPVRDAYGCGTRIPALLVSPWARRGYIDHRTTDTTAILALIEARFGFAPLAAVDASAYNLLDGLDFSQKGRAPVFE